MADSYVLYEHAAGYGLFAAKSFDEIGSHQQELEASIKDLSRFNSCVHLVGFLPFKTGVVALSNANAISEGLVTEELKVFLDSNLPAKRKQVTLGVSDSKIGAAISEELKISCKHGAQVLEVIRGIRLHFHKMLKGLSAEASFKAQLGLGHSYSRAKVKFNVNKSDNMIIQSIALLDQLDKDINTFSMRIREWYSYHFPELIKIVPNNYMFARCTLIIRDREKIDADKVLPQLEEIIMDSAKAQAIIDATKSSMGMEISALDLINIERFANRVVALSDYRMSLQNYLAEKMKQVAPNLGELIGDTVAARLISHAGSLTNLAKYPASTVQILGAEKALFRALKTRGNTPKYGLLFHSTFIGRAGVKNKGRISRYLANKCSLASRIDCFSEEASSVFGQKLREQVEDRLKFYESGDVPKKNVDVMKEATEENQALLAKKARKKMRKEMKISKEGQGQVEEEASGNGVVVKEKKKKKRKLADDSLTAGGVTDNGVSHMNGEGDAPVKKKKNKKNKEIEMELN